MSEMEVLPLEVNPDALPLALGIMITHANAWNRFSLKWTSVPGIRINYRLFDTDLEACRYLAELIPEFDWLGVYPEQKLESERWFKIADEMVDPDHPKFWEHLYDFNYNEMPYIKYLVQYSLSLADIYLWTALYKNREWRDSVTMIKTWENTFTWFSFIKSHPCILDGLARLKPPKNASASGKGHKHH